MYHLKKHQNLSKLIKNTWSENKLFEKRKAVKILQTRRSCKFLINYFLQKYHPELLLISLYLYYLKSIYSK